MPGLSLRSVALLGNLSGGAAPAFESIASTVLSSPSSSITFSSIPQDYTSLQLRVMARYNMAVTERLALRINGDTSANSYVTHRIDGDGANVSAVGTPSGSLTEIICFNALTGASATANVFGVAILDFHNYTSTTQNKTVRAFFGNDRNGAGTIGLSSGLFLSTSAITSLTLIYSPYSFVENTTVSLYGIKAAA